MKSIANVVRSVLVDLPEVPSAFKFAYDTGYEQFCVKCNAPEQMAHDDESLKAAERFVTVARNWTPLAWRLYGTWCGLVQVCLLLRCSIFDHDLHDDGSHFGPNSGTEHVSCRRCGFSWSHTYY